MGLKIDEIIKNVNKKAKEEILTQGLSEFSYERIPFTSPRMNYMTYGGLAVGKLTEFFGENHGGKTTTALDIVANFQNMFPDKDVLYVDAENSLDREWAIKLGVNVDRMYILQPKAQSAEEIFQMMIDIIDTGEIGLWILDSIGALLSAQAWEKDLTQKTYAGVSKALTEFTQKAEQLLAKYHCTGIGINQLRADMNSPWGGMKTPGGEAWKFLCSTRIQFSMGKFFDEKGNDLTRSAENPAGNYVMASIVKNKTAPPSKRIGQYRIRYAIGIDYLSDLIDVAILDGIIEQKGAWFTIIDTETGEILKDKIQGQANVKEVLDNEIEITKRIEELIEKKAKE